MKISGPQTYRRNTEMIHERLGGKDISHILRRRCLLPQFIHKRCDIAIKILRPKRIIRNNQKCRFRVGQSLRIQFG